MRSPGRLLPPKQEKQPGRCTESRCPEGGTRQRGPEPGQESLTRGGPSPEAQCAQVSELTSVSSASQSPTVSPQRLAQRPPGRLAQRPPGPPAGERGRTHLKHSPAPVLRHETCPRGTVSDQSLVSWSLTRAQGLGKGNHPTAPRQAGKTLRCACEFRRPEAQTREGLNLTRGCVLGSIRSVVAAA